MNHLKRVKQLAIITALTEGNSIRSVSRMTGVHKTTIASLLYSVGQGCEYLLEHYMRNLECKYVEADETWCYVGKKQKRLTYGELQNGSEFGDQYIFFAMDADTKLVPTCLIGKRTAENAVSFLMNLKQRTKSKKYNSQVMLFVPMKNR